MARQQNCAHEVSLTGRNPQESFPCAEVSPGGPFKVKLFFTAKWSRSQRFFGHLARVCVCVRVYRTLSQRKYALASLC